MKRLHKQGFWSFCEDVKKKLRFLSEVEPDGSVKRSLAASFAIFLDKKMAERVGFEPTVGYPTAVFKTAALNHSTISPVVTIQYTQKIKNQV